MPDSQGKKKQEMMSFEELYDRHFAAVNRYLRCRVPNFWDADDLTAIVFIKAMENYHRFRGEAPVSVWLFRICHNTYVDYMRSYRKTLCLHDMVVPAQECEQPEEEYLQQEELVQLKHHLQMLPGEYRDVISLRYMGELKFKQIAQVLGKTDSAVRMIHYRALRMLRAIMTEERGEMQR